MPPQEKSRGPKPERIKIDEDWEDAVEKALRKEKPKEGWPKPNDQKSDEKSHSEGDSESAD